MEAIKQKIQYTAIIIPTLGNRPNYLEECLKSILRAGNPVIMVVCPAGINFSNYVNKTVDIFVRDPGKGLPAAINYAVSQLPPEVKFFNWLGDDDLLAENSLNYTSIVLEKNTSVSAVYGQCEYINQDSIRMGVNHSGVWAKKILKFGPDLVPQPGALLRLDAFRKVGGLDTRYKLAFDFDLFIKLKSLGELQYIPLLLGRFRWHSDSLSVSIRRTSVLEASRIRLSYLPRYMKVISILWEPLVIIATYLAGLILVLRLKFMS